MRYDLGRLDAFLLRALLLCTVPLLAFLLLGPLLLIPLHVPLGYNEGWNAYLAARAVGPQGGPLYPPADTLVFNNYPPLSFYLVGLLGRFLFGGDVIVAGRIVALTSLLASAVLLAVCVARLGGSRRGALCAAALLLFYATTFFRGYVAVDEPQWLGHALMLAGLAVLLRDHAIGRYPVGRMVAAALLVAAGGFVKHSLVALPLAMTAWLALVRPRMAAVWLAAAIGAVAVGLALTAVLHGRAAFADVLLHRRVLRPGRAVLAVWRMLPLLPMMAVALLAWRRRRRGDRSMPFAALFVAIALATSVAQRVGEGVNYNAYFEATIALCLLIGLAVSDDGLRLRAGGGTVRPATLTLVAALALLVTMPGHLRQAWRDIADREARARSWQPVIAAMAASPGLVGCQALSLCFWAGKPYAVDMFNLNQSILTGGSIARFDRLARTHAFSLFQYDRGAFHGMTPLASTNSDRLLRDLLGHGYAPVAVDPDGNVMLVPRSR